MAKDWGLRRADKAITDLDTLRGIVDKAPVLRLGMVDEGEPYVVPVNFARDGDDVWVHSAQSGRKLECLRRNPSVCVEVDELLGIERGSDTDPCTGWTSRYVSVIAFGAAEIVDNRREKLRGLGHIMRKYSGRDDWEYSEKQVEETAVIRIRLSAMTGKRSPAAHRSS